MNIYKSFSEVPYDPETVLTVGTFDGVHRGHQQILNRLISVSKEQNLRGIVLTFDPHPQIVLTKKDLKPIKILTTISERLALFEKFNVENVLVIPFDYDFSRTDSKDFVSNYLCRQVGMKKILIGYDHNFGKNREGDESLLNELHTTHNFEIEKIGPLTDEEIIISSTKIRQSLQSGNLDFANEMLGYPYLVEGTVVLGNRRGTTLNYPTANVDPKDENKLMPQTGVYFVSSVIDGKLLFGMANLGTRPTFDDDNRIILEVNYFDFSGDLYGKKISVSFIKYIRPELKFPDVDSLLAAMKKDYEFCQEQIKIFRS